MRPDSVSSGSELRSPDPSVVPNPAPAFRLGYRPELDGIRAIAILAVLLRHAPIPGWQRGALWGGWIGVDIFFVLSGFLITTLLLQEYRQDSGISLQRFYARRALRLAPALVVMLVLWCGYSWIGFSELEARLTCRQALVTLLYMTNWVSAFCLFPMDQLAPMWSLAVEEQFYIVWPITLVILFRLGARARTLIVVLGIGVILSASLRIWLFTNVPCNLERMYCGSDTRADTLLIGCILGVLAVSGVLARLKPYRKSLGAAAILSTVVLVFVGSLILESRWILFFGVFTLVALATAVVLAWLLCHPESRVAKVLSSYPMVWIGRRSYGIYLWHSPIAVAVSTPLTYMIVGEEPHWAITLGMYLLCAFIVAAISFRYVEQPVLELKRRFETVKA